MRLNQLEYNNRLNHRKLLFLKVRNDLIPAILCDSTIFGIEGDDNVKESTYEILKHFVNAS